MIRIYCIEDINDMKYIGSTKKNVNQRFTKHKSNKKRGEYCSSSKLHLEHSIIYEIERCHENERREREGYWINQTDCVNEKKLKFSKKDHMKQYRQINKDIIKQQKREYQQRCKIYKFLKILDEY